MVGAPPLAAQRTGARKESGWLRRLFDLRFEVTEDSMSPGFQPGDRVRVDGGAYRAARPDRGDVVIVRDPSNAHRRLVKRVIGVPGDRIYLIGERLCVLRPGADEDRVLRDAESRGSTIVVWSLHDAVFVAGDNRRRSRDSRHFGPVPLHAIVGRPVYRYFPVNRRGPI